MSRRIKVLTIVAAVIGVLAVPSHASAVRGCDDPSDRSCCSVVEVLKGCRN